MLLVGHADALLGHHGAAAPGRAGTAPLRSLRRVSTARRRPPEAVTPGAARRQPVPPAGSASGAAGGSGLSASRDRRCLSRRATWSSKGRPRRHSPGSRSTAKMAPPAPLLAGGRRAGRGGSEDGAGLCPPACRGRVPPATPPLRPCPPVPLRRRLWRTGCGARRDPGGRSATGPGSRRSPGGGRGLAAAFRRAPAAEVVAAVRGTPRRSSTALRGGNARTGCGDGAPCHVCPCFSAAVSVREAGTFLMNFSRFVNSKTRKRGEISAIVNEVKVWLWTVLRICSGCVFVSSFSAGLRRALHGERAAQLHRERSVPKVPCCMAVCSAGRRHRAWRGGRNPKAVTAHCWADVWLSGFLLRCKRRLQN